MRYHYYYYRLLTITAVLLGGCESRRRLPSELSDTARSAPSSNSGSRSSFSRSSRHNYFHFLHHRLIQANHLTPPTRDDHLVTNLPLLNLTDFSSRHYAGHIPLDYTVDDKAFFYWLFEADVGDSSVNSGDNDNDNLVPLLIWLNGGPACSSMDGLFIENGPFRLKDFSKDDMSKARIEVNPYSWHKAPAHVVYIDQPVGTGLSYSKSKKWCKNDAEINADFYAFMQNFFKVHAELFLNEDGKRTRRQVYFAGESHAGHYIPNFIKYISDKNAEIGSSSDSSSNIFIDIQGGAIGNGWVDPYHQYAGAEAAYGAGFIDLSQKRILDSKEKECQSQLAKGSYNNKICLELINSIVAQSNSGRSHVLIYDNRKFGTPFPPGKYDIERFLGGNTYSNSSEDQKDLSVKVLEAIHATEAAKAGQYYLECTNPPYYALKHQDGLGVVPQVEAILERNIRLMFYNGMNDLICNHVGNEVMIENLNWSKINQWKLAKRFVWRTNNSNEPIGYMREFENLSYLKLREAGHMVPLDQPEVTLSMIRLFLQQKSFATASQVLDSSSEASSSCPVCQTCNEDTSSPQESVERPKKEVTDADLSTSTGKSGHEIVINRTHFIAAAWIAVICLCVISLAILKSRSSTSSGALGTAPVYKVTRHSEEEVSDVEQYADEHEQIHSDVGRFRID